MKIFLRICSFALICVVDNTAIAVSNSSTPSRVPSRENMAKIVNADYVRPPTAVSECIGRLVFDLPGKVEWASAPVFSIGEPFSFRFSDNVFDRGDRIDIGNIKIAVFENFGDKEKKILVRAKVDSREQEARASLVDAIRRLAELKKKPATTDKERHALVMEQSWIDSYKKSLADLKKLEMLVDSDDLYVYETIQEASRGDPPESKLRAHIMRPPNAFIFKSQKPIENAAEKAAHRQEFLRAISSFRPRRTGEIPSELGICIPHGFFADDGKTAMAVKQTFRWSDAPGVLYSMDTGKVDPTAFKSTLLLAGVRAGVGKFGTLAEEPMKKYETQRIGPRQVPLGGLTAEQGGVALKIRNQGNAEVVETYSVFTGYAGWLGTDVLPHIVVEMRSLRKEQAPELKSNPPPFDQSLDRLQKFLATVRLRPTTPPMPELR